jgi:hypothetical protein
MRGNLTAGKATELPPAPLRRRYRRVKGVRRVWGTFGLL